MKLGAVISVAGVLAVYLLRLDGVFGLFLDDAWYLMLAKALATGQGYVLINSPTPGIVPVYPPAFPFLLSLVYRLSPDFPGNLPLLKSLSIAAMLAAGGVAFRYFRRERGLAALPAWGLALAVALNPPLVFLATSTLMSECVFLCVFLLAVAALERGVREAREGKGWPWLIAGSLLSAAALLLRSAAVGLVVAALLYLFLARRFRAAAAFALIVAAACGPWMIYSRQHQPTLAEQREQGGHIMQPYTEQFWQKRAGDTTAGRISIGDLPARLGAKSLEVAGSDVLRILAAPTVQFFTDPNLEERGSPRPQPGRAPRHAASFLLSLVVLAGLAATAARGIALAEIAFVLSVGVTLLWPWGTLRFMLPLAPFLMYYLIAGCGVIGRFVARRARRGSPEWIPAAAAGLLVAGSLFGHVSYLANRGAGPGEPRPFWQATFEESERMMEFMNRELSGEGAVATTNPPFVYLFTGRPTVDAGNIVANWQTWRRLGVRYMARAAVCSRDVAAPEKSGFRVLYKSQQQRGLWLVDFGAPVGQGR